MPDTGLVQPGSKLGMAARHDVPTTTGMGSGTIVSAGLTVLNADYREGVQPACSTERR